MGVGFKVFDDIFRVRFYPDLCRGGGHPGSGAHVRILEGKDRAVIDCVHYGVLVQALSEYIRGRSFNFPAFAGSLFVGFENRSPRETEKQVFFEVVYDV